MSATMNLHPYVVQPTGDERRELIAKASMLSEGIRDMRSRLAIDLRRIRRETESLRAAEAEREQIRKKLRGEL